MAKGIFAGKRAHLHPDFISRPTLTHTDAMPRKDLELLGSISGRSNDRQIANDSRGRGFPPGNAEFDFTTKASPSPERVASPLSVTGGVNAGMIGVALASPSMIGHPKCPSLSERMHLQEAVRQTPQQAGLLPKQSRWRKIGSLFRAKHAITGPARKSPKLVKADQWPSQNCLAVTNAGSAYPTEDWPAAKPDNANEEWPRLQPEQLGMRNREGNFPTPDANIYRQRFRAEDGNLNLSPPPPLLQVNIPAVEMERYSVMFGNLLAPNQRTLLARRSKTLGDIRLIEPEVLFFSGTVTSSPAAINILPDTYVLIASQSSSESPTSHIACTLVHEQLLIVSSDPKQRPQGSKSTSSATRSKPLEIVSRRVHRSAGRADKSGRPPDARVAQFLDGVAHVTELVDVQFVNVPTVPKPRTQSRCAATA